MVRGYILLISLSPLRRKKWLVLWQRGVLWRQCWRHRQPLQKHSCRYIEASRTVFTEPVFLKHWPPHSWLEIKEMKLLLTTPTPHICKKNMPPKDAIQWGSVWHRSRLKSRDFYRNMAYGPPKYGIRPPPFMPYEPFLLGVGVVVNLLKKDQEQKLPVQVFLVGIREQRRLVRKNTYW